MKFILSAMVGATLAFSAIEADAQATPGERQVSLTIESTSLATALDKWAQQSGFQIFVQDWEDAKRLTAPSLMGTFSAQAALEQLLKGTQLTYVWLNDRAVSIRKKVSPTVPTALHSSDDDRAPSSLVPITRFDGETSDEQRFAADDQYRGPQSDQGRTIRTIRTAAESVDQLEEIVVTGTLIHGETPVGSLITTITAEDIQRAGFTTTQQIVASLPQNSSLGPTELGSSSFGVTRQLGAVNDTGASGVNIRGLGPYSTLVLINGHRLARGGDAGIYFDVSMIPVSAISRVEVLSDGASSLYGSDAVGGVINFIMKREYTGAQSSAKGSWLSGGAKDEYQVSQVVGRDWNSGSVLAAVDFYSHDRLPASFSPFYSDDLRAIGGPDLRSEACNPGNLIGATQSYAIPSGQNGTNLDPSQLTAGEVNLCDSRGGTDILGKQRRLSGLVSARQDLSDNASLFLDATWSGRRFDQHVPDGDIFAQFLSVPSTNPHYVNPEGGTDPVTVHYSFADDLGPATLNGKADLYAVTAGMELGLSARWRGEINGTLSKSHDAYESKNVVNTFHLNEALASSDVSTAFNPFGDAAVNSASIVESIRGFLDVDMKTKVANLIAKADGDLFEIRGRTVKLAVGVEYREESFSNDLLDYRSQEMPTLLPVRPLSRDIYAGYGELKIPLTGESTTTPLLRSLDFSISGRYEHYSDFGNTTNPKVGLSWEPIADLRFRATHGRSFRAPSFREQRQDPGSAAYFVTEIPNQSGGFSPVLALFGNKEGIGPEKSSTTTVGLDFTLPALESFKTALTYFDIEYDKKIADLSSLFFQALTDPSVASIVTLNPSDAELAAFYASPKFAGFFVPGDPVAIIDGQTQNISSERQKGFDIELSYATRLRSSEITASFSATHILSDDQRLAPSAAASDAAGTIFGPVDWRGRASVGWSREQVGVFAYLNYVDRYRNTQLPQPVEVSSWATVDLTLSYLGQVGLLAGTRFAVVAQNLFDKDPPFALNPGNGAFALGYDPQNSNPLGRVLSLQLSKNW